MRRKPVVGPHDNKIRMMSVIWMSICVAEGGKVTYLGRGRK